MESCKILLLILAFFSPITHAELMKVQDLRGLLDLGEGGEAIVTAYVQGVIEGMVGLDSLRKKERNSPYDFCKMHADLGKGQPAQEHPASKARFLVITWEKNGYPMDTLAVDMVLAFMTQKYGC